MKSKVLSLIKEIKIAELILAAMVFLQIAFIFYTDMTKVPLFLDNDAAKSMVHAIEIYNQKTVFLKNWSMMTTLETGTPTFIAVFVYAFTHNVYTSYAVANLIILILYILIFREIGKRLGVSKTGGLVSIILLLTPFSFGQLLYYNMMFYAAGAYSVRIIIPLLMVILLTDEESSTLKWGTTLAFTTLLCFLCGISTGVYVVITALLPTIVVYVWTDILRRKSIFSKFFCRNNISCIVVCTFTLVGYILYKKMVGSSYGMEMEIVSIKRLIETSLELITSWFEMFGAFPYAEIAVLSVSGLMNVFKFIIAIICLSSCFYCGRYAIRGMAPQESDANDDGVNRQNVIYAMLLMVALFDLFICVVTGSGANCRYGLLIIVPSFIFTGVLVSDFSQKKTLSCGQHFFLQYGMIAILAITILLSNKTVLDGIEMPMQKDNNVKLQALIEKFSEYPIKQIYFLNDTGATENVTLLDYYSDRVYSSYMLAGDEWNHVGVNVHDYFITITESMEMDQDNIIVVNSELGNFEDIPEYIRKNYTFVDEYANYSIYIADSNRLDGASGYEAVAKSRDYCYTDGYEIYYGNINGDGCLEAVGNGDYVISSSPLGEAEGNLTITMNYSSDNGSGKIGKIEAYDCYTGELVGESEIDGSNRSVCVDSIELSGRNVAIKVLLYADENIIINDFIFER